MNEEMTSFEVLNGSTGEAAQLDMQGLWLTGRITPSGARLVVVHHFRSSAHAPLEVVYAFGLPRDAALRRFRIEGDGFRAHSELRPTDEARKEYERGVQQGSLSSLAQTYRDGRVNLSVGNLRPGETVRVFLELVAGVELRDNGLRFRFPFTLAPCYHRKARSIESASGVGEIELPPDEFGDLLLPPFMRDASALQASVRRTGTAMEVTLSGRSWIRNEAGRAWERIGLTPPARSGQHTLRHEILGTVVAQHDALVGACARALELDVPGRRPFTAPVPGTERGSRAGTRFQDRKSVV